MSCEVVSIYKSQTYIMWYLYIVFVCSDIARIYVNIYRYLQVLIILCLYVWLIMVQNTTSN